MKLNIKTLTIFMTIVMGLSAQQAMAGELAKVDFTRANVTPVDKTVLDGVTSGGTWTGPTITGTPVSNKIDNNSWFMDYDNVGTLTATLELATAVDFSQSAAVFMIDLDPLTRANVGVSGVYVIGLDNAGAELFKLYIAAGNKIPTQPAGLTGNVDKATLAYFPTTTQITTLLPALAMKNTSTNMGAVATLALSLNSYSITITDSSADTSVPNLSYLSGSDGATLAKVMIKLDSDYTAASIKINSISISQATASLAINDSYSMEYSSPSFPHALTVVDGPTDLLANDILNPSTDEVLAVPSGTSSHGTYVINADGSFTYTPANDFVGADTFTYDLVATGTTSPVISSGTVSIEVENSTIARDDGTGAFVGETALGNVLINDSIGNGGTMTIDTSNLSSPGNLTFDLDGSGSGKGTFSYSIPATNTVMSKESFTYTIDQKTATVFIDTFGQLFHYKFDEPSTATELTDSLGQFVDSDTLPTTTDAAVLPRGVGYSVQDECNSIEIQPASHGIKLSFVNPLETHAGTTFVTWMKPKVGSALSDGSGIFSRVSGPVKNCFLDIKGTGSPVSLDDPLPLRMNWIGSIVNPLTSTVTVGHWNFVAITVDQSTGVLTIYTGLADSPTATALTKEVRTGAPPYKSFSYFHYLSIGYHQGDLQGNMRNFRMYNYAVPETSSTRSVTGLQEIFDAEKNMVITPVVGLELVQEGTDLTWTLEDEVGVIEYQVVVGGEVVETITADGSESYSFTLDSDTKAELVVVDNHGSQTYVPADGNIITTPYNLKKGWNLIAITGDHADISPLISVASGPLWAWNGSTYERTTAPTATQAIWVNAKVSKRVDVKAEKSDAIITLTPGWTLAGPTNNEVIPAKALTVFSYDPDYDKVTEEDQVLIRGVGYWIFSL